MKRWLVIGGVAVVALAVVLVWKLRQPPAAVTATAPTPGATAVPVEPPSSGSSTPFVAPPPLARTQDPVRAGATVGGSGASAPVTPSVDYEVGNVQIRDHRGSNAVQLDVPPNIHRPDGRKVSTTVVSDLTAKMRAVLAACAKDIPPEARGPKPRMEGAITIAIKSHQVSVSSSVLKLRDVVGAAVDPTQQCLEQGANALTEVAPDESDVEAYQINLSFAVL